MAHWQYEVRFKVNGLECLEHCRVWDSGYFVAIIDAKKVVGDQCRTDGVTVSMELTPRDDIWDHECRCHAPEASHWCCPGDNITDKRWKSHGGLCIGKDHHT